MSSDGGDAGEEVYCICRTSESDRFMIGCDACEEWYHGDCINVTEREAKNMKRFFCHRCRKKDPNLKNKYKEKHKSAHKSDKGEKANKTEKLEKVEKIEKPEKHEKPEKSHNKDKHEKIHKHDKHEKADKHEKHEKFEKLEASKKHEKAEKREKTDKLEKHEKPEKHDKPEKHIKPEKHEKLSTKHEKPEKKSKEERQKLREKKEAAAEKPAPRSDVRFPPPSGCKLCVPCNRSTECGRCTACRDMPAFGGDGRLKRPCKKRLCTGPPSPDPPPPPPEPEPEQKSPSPVLREVNHRVESPLAAPPSPSPPPPPPPPPKQRQERRKSQETRRAAGAGRRRKRALSDEEEDELDASARQCCGPQCVKASRAGSRYCSDQCGLNLARNRIFQVLPQRIQEWNMTRCVAEDRNMRTLERIRRDQLEAQTQLERLQRSHAELDRTVERGRRGAVDPAALEDDSEDEQHSIHCVTCGHEVLTRNAVRHMEKCFGKYESQTSFGSLYQTRVEGFNMFCDFYNPAQRTYCKRLRVLCPEHSKNPKVADDEVCGSPLVVDVFQETGRYCRAPKKKCLRHFSWEKLRRAELDMERVRWAMKMDELLEQERQCRQSMASRAGVLALMLHSTYDHEVMEKVQSQQKKMASKVKVKVS